MHDDDNDVKIVDKRPFDADGTPREENVSESEEPVSDKVSPDKTKIDSGSTLPPKIDFSTFIVSLYTSAAAQMGLISLPGQAIETDLSVAKQTIDILDLLRDKTRGNLSEDESKLMEDLVAQLQLAFVQKWQKD